MKKLVLMLAALSASPAMAEGFNITQLIMADFELKAAVAVPGRAGGSGSEILYLQGKLPGGTYEVIMRCVARPDPEEGASNCEQVY
jgi:hypothetical protein